MQTKHRGCKDTRDEQRRKDNAEQWAKPLRQPVFIPSSVDMGRGHEP